MFMLLGTSHGRLSLCADLVTLKSAWRRTEVASTRRAPRYTVLLEYGFEHNLRSGGFTEPNVPKRNQSRWRSERHAGDWLRRFGRLFPTSYLALRHDGGGLLVAR